jgi:catechol 2,3-dioxygenase-like lactoylglutathione lyase family enzyme
MAESTPHGPSVAFGRIAAAIPVKGHKGGSHNTAHLMVADAAGLHHALVSNDVRIIKGLRDADYGLRGFVFADPDGNRIDVGQRLPPRSHAGGTPG